MVEESGGAVVPAPVAVLLPPSRPGMGQALIFVNITCVPEKGISASPLVLISLF